MSVEDAPPVFPFTTADPLEPPREYAKLRQEKPVVQVTLPSGEPVWLVTRYEDVRAVLADQRFSREAITLPDAPRILPIAQRSKSIFVMDPPEHTRLRRLVSKAFHPRRIEALRPRVQEITDGLLDAMVEPGPPADLVSSLAQPLPITVICELLGVPYRDLEQFQAWTDIMLDFDTNRREEVLAARGRLNAYLTALIAAKRRNPTDDLLMALIYAQEEGDRLSEEELLAFGYTLLGAGYHATTGAIIHSTLVLLRAPEELHRLRDDPRLLPTAVDELLRYSQAGSGLGALRIATHDVELCGVLIRAGDAVLPSINSANRDSTVFVDADRLELARALNPHVAFGHGIHYCLGAQLGRIELEIALGSMLRRLPDLRLGVSAEDLRWSAGRAFRRPTELPIVW